MKKHLLLVCFCGVLLSGFAQSVIRPNNFWENLYYINPASFSNKYMSVYSLAGRKQWLNFPGAPTTFFLTATHYIPRMHVQIGLKAYEDKIGYTSLSNVSASYTYISMLNESWRINLGLNGSFQNLWYDMAAVNSSVDDPAIFQKLSSTKSYNADMGLELANKDWRIGASSHNLLSLFSSEEKPQVNINYLYGLYRHNSDEFYEFGNGIALVQAKKLFQPEMNVTGFFKDNRMADLFQVSAFYRAKNEVGCIFGIHLNSSLYCSYSYDFDFGAISNSSVGSHEVMLIYRINKCPTCW